MLNANDGVSKTVILETFSCFHRQEKKLKGNESKAEVFGKIFNSCF